MRSSLKKIERIMDILDLNGDVLSYKYTDESKNNLTTAISKATEFINKAKETRNLEDTRSSLLKEIEESGRFVFVIPEFSAENPLKEDETDYFIKASALCHINKLSKIIAVDSR